MKIVFFALAIFLAVTSVAGSVAPEDKALHEQFGQWQKQFQKQYVMGTPAAEKAFANFKASVKRVAERQSKVDPTITQYGLTKFADLSPAEFEAIYLRGVKKPTIDMDPARVAPKPRIQAKDLPASFDWTEKGATTYVRDQGQCGSCWAFSVAEQIESAWWMAGHSLVALSPQQFLDCDGLDAGCDGGDPVNAYKYVIEEGGLNTEDQYPYRESQHTCKFNDKHIEVKISNWTYAIPPCNDTCKNQDEALLRQQLVTLGPLSICVYATQEWQDYKSGTIGYGCASDAEYLNHAVQLVGYEQWDDAKGNGHWKVRNSWGSNWGESGYIYLRGHKNACGMGDLVLAAVI